MNSSMYRATGLLAIKNELVLANLWNKQAVVSLFILLASSYVFIRSLIVVIASLI